MTQPLNLCLRYEKMWACYHFRLRSGNSEVAVDNRIYVDKVYLLRRTCKMTSFCFVRLIRNPPYKEGPFYDDLSRSKHDFLV